MLCKMENEKYECCPTNLRKDFDIFLRIMEAKDGHEIEDIPSESILGLFNNLDTFIGLLNLDNDYTLENLKKNLCSLKANKRRIL